MPITSDYSERVYAGVLGKVIGVYLGRPFEGWWYDRIMKELGEVWYYVNEKLQRPLVVTDDDISGTFTFLQALPDNGNAAAITPAQIGRAWLNYIIERRTILWWGGLGNSTEHTAYIRLKHGIDAPASGSIATNGKTMAEQIGAQIFIDGWAMVSPGDPELAASLAKKAASVSHDGEAIYGAQVVAAIEAQAFVERDLGKLLDTAIRFIPKDSDIYRLIGDLRDWRTAEPDWHKARKRVDDKYGYARYPGHVHMVPNHAVIILALLYGDDDFQKSLMIANTAGWDTDCNSGNVGCILGIKNGMQAIESGPDWRGPWADRILLPTADGGRCITDAVLVARDIARSAYALAGIAAPKPPKDGARFSFEQPGSVQGFSATVLPAGGEIPRLENVLGHSAVGDRSLAIRFSGVGPARSAMVSTPTFITPDLLEDMHYELYASPTIYAGQTMTLRVEADPANKGAIEVVPCYSVYGANDEISIVRGKGKTLKAGGSAIMSLEVGDIGGRPIESVGLIIESAERAEGTIYLDYLAWTGAPSVDFVDPADGGTIWRRAWVNAADQFNPRWKKAFTLSHNDGTGMLITGTREWTDYEVTSTVAADLAAEFGIAARNRGLLRYYALLLTADKKLLLVKEREGRTVLASAPFDWKLSTDYALTLTVKGNEITGTVDGKTSVRAVDDREPLISGGIALICTEGRIETDRVSVRPAP